MLQLALREWRDVGGEHRVVLLYAMLQYQSTGEKSEEEMKRDEDQW